MLFYTTCTLSCAISDLVRLRYWQNLKYVFVHLGARSQMGFWLNLGSAISVGTARRQKLRRAPFRAALQEPHNASICEANCAALGPCHGAFRERATKAHGERIRRKYIKCSKAWGDLR